MFGSTVLEVAIGLVLCYGSVALIVSSLNEAIASVLRLRARSLLSGIKAMLNDPYFEAMALAIYRHGLINPLGDGRAIKPHDMQGKPSYIHAAHFATALIDTVQSVPGDFVQLGRDIGMIHDAQLNQLLSGIYQRAGGDMVKFEAGVSAWFDASMERVSGAYKRRSQLISVLVGLALAMAFNIDSVRLFATLWQHPALSAQIGAAAPSAGQLDALFRLPVGWEAAPAFDRHLPAQLAGWLVTASAALFGAPFWFDLLQRLVQLRGTGDKPQTRPPREHTARQA